MRRLGWVLLTLCSLSVPAVADSVLQGASLRHELPENTVGYVRIPSFWGLLSAEQHSSLQPAQAHPAHQQQIATLLTAVRNTLLPQFKDSDVPMPLLNALFSDVRSPLELAVLLPPNVPPTSALGLFRARLSADSLEAANAWLQHMLELPVLELLQPFDDKGIAIVKTDSLPLLLHFAPQTRQLHVMIGLLATTDSLLQTLNTLQAQEQHPMYALEQPIDSSGQGLFAWVNLEKLLPLVQATLPPEAQQNVQRSGLDKARGLAFGYGSSQGKGRLQLVLDAPKSGYRALLPPISNDLALSTSGQPNWVMSLNLPAKALWQNLHTFAQTEMPSLLVELQKAQSQFQEQAGVSLDDVLSAFGGEILVFSDEAGEFAAIRLADKARFAQLLHTLVDKFALAYNTHAAHGATYHHLKTPVPFTDEMASENDPSLQWMAMLLKHLKSHYFWMEEGDYLVFAKTPQSLFDRSQQVNRVVLKQWLNNTQKQAYESSLFLLSVNTGKLPRQIYSLYLQLLLLLGDLADASLDPFALPSAHDLKLAEQGTYGLNLFLGEEQTGLALTFENNPLEFMLNVYGGGAGAVAAAGILAAVAIPAYTDYLARSQVAEGIGLLAGLKTPAEEFFYSKGHLPTLEEIGGKAEGKYTSRVYLLEDGSGYAAEFRDPKIQGRVLLRYDSTKNLWACSSEAMSLAYLPSACK